VITKTRPFEKVARSGRQGPHISKNNLPSTPVHKRRWITERELLAEFKYLSARALARQLQRRATNGLAPYVKVKPGRRLIHAEGYAEWVRSKTTAGDSNDNGGQS
jgi:hypothetical protein